jgi:hypothetical protein
MIDIRLRTKVADPAVAALAGKILGPADYDLLLTGPTYVRMPDNRPLAVYLPAALAGVTDERVYAVLHSLKSITTNNRGLASGTRRLRRGANTGNLAARTESRSVASTLLGAMDPSGQRRYCRLTSWTGRHLPEWQALQPFLQRIAAEFRAHVPDRYANQQAQAERTHPDWVVPGTPYTTITVNNTFPTGVHTDKGDLDAGFSSIAVLRRGPYTGGNLVFPQYRVAVDLHDGDLILMDAHQWHGNTALTCGCGRRPNGPCDACGAERISVVSYMRTRIVNCADAATENSRAQHLAEARAGFPPDPGPPDPDHGV